MRPPFGIPPSPSSPMRGSGTGMHGARTLHNKGSVASPRPDAEGLPLHSRLPPAGTGAKPAARADPNLRRDRMPVRLDAIDWRILKELQADGRITNVALAARVGLS